MIGLRNTVNRTFKATYALSVALMLVFLCGCGSNSTMGAESKLTVDEVNVVKLLLYSLSDIIDKDFLLYDTLMEDEHGKSQLDSLLLTAWPFFTDEEAESIRDQRGSKVSLRAQSSLFRPGSCEITDQRSPTGDQFVVRLSRPLISSNGKKGVIHQFRLNKHSISGCTYIYKRDDEMQWTLSGLRTDHYLESQ
jgi:hypothetical protein